MHRVPHAQNAHTYTHAHSRIHTHTHARASVSPLPPVPQGGGVQGGGVQSRRGGGHSRRTSDLAGSVGSMPPEDDLTIMDDASQVSPPFV